MLGTVPGAGDLRVNEAEIPVSTAFSASTSSSLDGLLMRPGDCSLPIDSCCRMALTYSPGQPVNSSSPQCPCQDFHLSFPRSSCLGMPSILHQLPDSQRRHSPDSDFSGQLRVRPGCRQCKDLRPACSHSSALGKGLP